MNTLLVVVNALGVLFFGWGVVQELRSTVKDLVQALALFVIAGIFAANVAHNLGVL